MRKIFHLRDQFTKYEAAQFLMLLSCQHPLYKDNVRISFAKSIYDCGTKDIIPVYAYMPILYTKNDSFLSSITWDFKWHWWKIVEF